jgi:prophage DNA circulation protein
VLQVACALSSRLGISCAYRVLNLETNQIMETCEVTFDETQPRSQLVFECVGDDEFA